ncbi:uncharacterized protein LOC101238123 [Hydra vulgaris]|uniref:uncharacterized protein LOC101238123 n=1 Tax=Hydra vulgaris TaxID=6087 RepID=UPI0002B47AC7|nr:uncharacterized protein LOC101238123 [Hydra vulgaris]
MIGMLKYSDDFQKSTESTQLWFKDTTFTAVATDNLGFAARQVKIIQKPATKSTFSYCIPLKHIFGFCDDYDKVIYVVKHSLAITRKGDNDAIFRAAGVAAGKVNLTKVSLWMKHVIPSDTMRSVLFNHIYPKVILDVDFRSRICEYNSVTPNAMGFNFKLSGRNERPKYILLVIQTNRSGNQEVNPSVFDNCDLKAISVTLNGKRHPTNDYNLKFTNIQFSRAYLDSTTFNEKFYGTNQLYAQSSIHDAEFKELYPIYVVDLSK